MGKTTKRTQAAATPETVRTARRDDPTPSPPDPPPQNRPTAPPTGPAPLIGDPDFLPEVTFISEALPGDNGFIANAVAFHQKSGLQPKTVTSIEQILDLLADDSETGTGVLNRVRIVSHFFVPDDPASTQSSNMGIKFLTNGGRGALLSHFEGWAESSFAGLRGTMTFDNTASGQRTHLFYAGSSSTVLDALRAEGHTALADSIPVDPLGEIEDSELNEFVLICASKWVLDKENIIPAGDCRSNQHQAYDLLLEHLRQVIVNGALGLPEATMNSLRTEILGLTNIAGATFVAAPPAAFLGIHCAHLEAGIAAFTDDSFRNKLIAIRPRFDKFTTIDIRGCRAGTEVPYLAAVQAFFGRTTTVRPAVTAPRWFQRFNGIPVIRPHGTQPLARQAAINQLHNSGFAPFSRDQVRAEFEAWATAYGITAAHLTFWQNTFQSHVLLFSQMDWRNSIPAIHVAVSRLTAMAALSFADSLPAIADIFFTRSTRMPANAEITAMEAQLGNAAMFHSHLTATIPSSPSNAELATLFTQLRTAYEALDTRMSNPSFHTSSARLVPQTQPTPFGRAEADAMQTALRTFVDQNSNSLFHPLREFLDEANGLTQDAPARMRYFLALGLPFQLPHATSTDFDDQRLVFYQDLGGPSQRQDEAVHHWLRASWRGPTRANIPATVTAGDLSAFGPESAWVVEGRNAGPCGVCPHSSYQDKIVTQPA